MEKQAKQVAELLKVLANQNRLMVLNILIEQPMMVSEIAKRIPKITQSALSQHLALLRAYGIVDFNRSGQNIIYSIADHRVEQVIHILKKYYCND